jgi:hypothetical protein
VTEREQRVEGESTEQRVESRKQGAGSREEKVEEHLLRHHDLSQATLVTHGLARVVVRGAAAHPVTLELFSRVDEASRLLVGPAGLT